MPIYRAYFATSKLARDRATAAVDLLKARAGTAARAAGSLGTTTAPTVPLQILGTSEIPSVAIPTATESISEMLIRPTTLDGRGEAMRAHLPTAAAATLLSVSSARVAYTAAALVYPKVTLKARLAATVLVQSAVATSLVDGTIIQDPATAKQYKVNGTQSVAIGGTNINVVQVSSTQLGDVSYGSTLIITTPPLGVIPFVQVVVMKDAVLSDSRELRDKKGRHYVTGTIGTASSATPLLAGDLTLDVGYVRDLDDGMDPTSLAVGDELYFVDPPTSIARTAVVSEAYNATVPAGTILKDLSTGLLYESVADALLTDGLYAETNVRAPVPGSEYDLAISVSLRLQTVPAGIDMDATVIGVSPCSTFPETYPSQVIGADIEWRSSVRRAPDGRWIAEVYSQPFGS